MAVSLDSVKAILKESTTFLCENLRPVPLLQDLMIATAISRDDVDTINQERGDKVKIYTLLDILGTSSITSYEAFMRWLKQNRGADGDLYTKVKAIQDKLCAPTPAQPTSTPDIPASSPVPPVPIPVIPDPINPSGTSSTGYDVMISYQWDAQERMKLLRQKLKTAGISVWIDVEQIVGNLNKAMAEGVEGSQAIIMCLSQKYHDSDNCRKEAELADRRKKNIIPLKYEMYKPAGWLDLIIGGDLYYDVSSDGALDKSFGDILKAIRRQPPNPVAVPSNPEPGQPEPEQATVTSSGNASGTPPQSVSETPAPAPIFSVNASDKLTDEDIGTITRKSDLNDDTLKILYVELGLKDHQIENAKRNADTTNFKLQGASILRLWRQTKGNEATKGAILIAMKKDDDLKAAMDSLMIKWKITFI